MKTKREQWELKATTNAETWRRFMVWCVQNDFTMARVMRAVAMAAGENDGTLKKIVWSHEEEEAKP